MLPGQEGKPAEVAVTLLEVSVPENELTISAIVDVLEERLLLPEENVMLVEELTILVVELNEICKLVVKAVENEIDDGESGLLEDDIDEDSEDSDNEEYEDWLDNSEDDDKDDGTDDKELGLLLESDELERPVELLLDKEDAALVLLVKEDRLLNKEVVMLVELEILTVEGKLLELVLVMNDLSADDDEEDEATFGEKLGRALEDKDDELL